jgi:7,8-dihydroneopterin aldolase/epimerase/oxygenase
MTDRILLSGVQVYAYGGVTAEEQRTGQRYSVDIELRLDLSRAAERDELGSTVSYAEVHDVVVASIRESPFALIEAAATRLTSRILDAFPVDGVTVRLTKLLPPIDGIVAGAGVEISRDRLQEG